jgi:hypothetical protein
MDLYGTHHHGLLFLGIILNTVEARVPQPRTLKFPFIVGVCPLELTVQTLNLAHKFLHVGLVIHDSSSSVLSAAGYSNQRNKPQ